MKSTNQLIRQSSNWGSLLIWQQAVSSQNLLRSSLYFGLSRPHHNFPSNSRACGITVVWLLSATSINMLLSGKIFTRCLSLWTQNWVRISQLTSCPSHPERCWQPVARHWHADAMVCFCSSGALVSWRDCRIDMQRYHVI